MLTKIKLYLRVMLNFLGHILKFSCESSPLYVSDFTAFFISCLHTPLRTQTTLSQRFIGYPFPLIKNTQAQTQPAAHCSTPHQSPATTREPVFTELECGVWLVHGLRPTSRLPRSSPTRLPLNQTASTAVPAGSLPETSRSQRGH